MIAADSDEEAKNRGALRQTLYDVLIGLDDGAAHVSRHSLAEAKTALCGDKNATHRDVIAASETRFPVLRRGERETPVYGLPEGSAVYFAIALCETARRS